MTIYHYCAKAYYNGSAVAVHDGILKTDDPDLTPDGLVEANGFHKLKEGIAAGFQPAQPPKAVVITSLSVLML